MKKFISVVTNVFVFVLVLVPTMAVLFTGIVVAESALERILEYGLPRISIMLCLIFTVIFDLTVTLEVNLIALLSRLEFVRNHTDITPMQYRGYIPVVYTIVRNLRK